MPVVDVLETTEGYRCIRSGWGMVLSMRSSQFLDKRSIDKSLKHNRNVRQQTFEALPTCYQFIGGHTASESAHT